MAEHLGNGYSTCWACGKDIKVYDVNFRDKYYCTKECLAEYRGTPKGELRNKKSRSCGMGQWPKGGD
jgi:hypothetical protein